MPANNVTRMLDAKKIAYTAFETEPVKLGARETARRLGVPAEIVYKTIVVKREKAGKLILAVVPGDAAVDLKRLASALGEKKLQLPTQAEAEKLTGLQAGGISPLALINRGFQVVIDERARSKDQIHISGGQRGLNIRIGTADLAGLVRARFAPISQPLAEGEEDAD